MTNTTDMPFTNLLKRGLFVLFVLGVGFCLFLLFFLPWFTVFPETLFDNELQEYYPLCNGCSRAYLRFDNQNQYSAYISANMIELGNSDLVSRLDEEEIAAINNKFQLFENKPYQDDLAYAFVIPLSTQIFLVDTKQLFYEDSSVKLEPVVLLRNQDGDYLVKGLFPDNRDDQIQVFDPPLLLRPARFEENASWLSEGKTTDGEKYHLQGTASFIGNFISRGVEYSDCWELAMVGSVTVDHIETPDSHIQEWVCAGVGSVEKHVRLISDTQSYKSYLLSSSDTYAAKKDFLPFLSTEQNTSIDVERQEGVVKPSEWILSRVGKVGLEGEELEGTNIPVWISGDPDLLLAATLNGDLIAYDADVADGTVRWRYHPIGTVFGRPTYTPVYDLILFGSSEGYLTAIDRQGLFVWSYKTGDNIASRVLVVDDRVLFGSEDRYLYCLDISNGSLLWRMKTGGAIASSASLWRDMVIIGSDDGVVYAVDYKTGDIVWEYETGDAIEAPIVSADSFVYIASRDLKLYALDAATGVVRWQALADEILRTAPSLYDNGVLIVSESGLLYDFNRTTGDLKSMNKENLFLGSPLIFEDYVFIGGTNNSVYFIQLDNLPNDINRIQPVNENEALDADFRFGLEKGRGAIWGFDTDGELWRLGPSDD